MPKVSKLVNETTMYSMHPQTNEVITHHLPWKRQSPQLEHYIERGFTFDRPAVTLKPMVDMGVDQRAMDNVADKPQTQPGTKPIVKTFDIVKDIPKGYYYCGKCQKNHMEASTQGRKHLKHKGG